MIRIGDNIFKGCDALSIVNFNGTKEEWEKISIAEENEELESKVKFL